MTNEEKRLVADVPVWLWDLVEGASEEIGMHKKVIVRKALVKLFAPYVKGKAETGNVKWQEFAERMWRGKE